MPTYRKPLIGLHIALLILLTLAFCGSRGQMSATERTILRVTQHDSESTDGAFVDLPPSSLRSPTTEREKAAASYFEKFRDALDKKHKALFRRLGELYGFFSIHNVILILALSLIGISAVLVWKQKPTAKLPVG